MKSGVKLILVFFLVLSLTFFSVASEKADKISGIQRPFLGQQPPGKTPQLFAQGIISTVKSEQNGVFSPDGREFYFTRVLAGFKFVSYMMQMDGTSWTEPEIASFYRTHEGGEPFISPDGRRLFFVARQNNEGIKTKFGDIWVMEKLNDKWGEPLHMDASVNSDFHEGYPTASRDGTLYFFSNRDGSIGGFDIFYSNMVDGKYGVAQSLGSRVNSPANEFNPCIAPDGSYLIFNSPNRPDGLGQQDLYVTFRNSDGEWSEPRNMGKNMNTEYNEYSAFVTADGKYLFFSSNRMMKSSSGYRVDIFWVDARIIEKFREQDKN